MVSQNNSRLVLRRIFMASRQQVFTAWTNATALEQWLRPRGMSITVSTLDVRVGGSFCFDLEDGSFIIGSYLHVASPEKLIFTWGGNVTHGQETVVTVDFLDQGGKTEVVLTHEGIQTPELSALFSSGWPSLFEMLAIVLLQSEPQK